MTWAGCFPQLAVLRVFRGCCAGRRNPNKAGRSLWDEQGKIRWLEFSRQYGRREDELYEESASKISKDFFITLQLSIDRHMHVRKLPKAERKNYPKGADITSSRAQIGLGIFCVSTSRSGKTSKCKGIKVEHPENIASLRG